MLTKYLQTSHIGFYFSLGVPPQDDSEYADKKRDFEACAPSVKAALSALPFWKQTDEEANDLMQVDPYALCQFDSEIECINGDMACSFWVDSQRLTLFPKDHAIAMRDAIASVVMKTCIKVKTYVEYNETGYADLEL